MSDTAEKNRGHWNEKASTYNSRFQKTIDQIIEEIQARKEWIGVDWVEDTSSSEDEKPELEIYKAPSKKPKKSVKLLDYACGTGLVSRALAPFTSQAVGIDLSEGMVAEYNLGASNQGIPPSEMHATLGNLIPSSSPNPTDSISGPEFFDFDIAVVGLGFHHFDRPALAAKRLAERLKVGGTLMIIDFMPHGIPHGSGHSHSHGDGDGDGHGHGHDHNHGHHSHGEGEEKIEGKTDVKETVTHHGFSEDQMRAMFEDAGVGKDFEYLVIGEGIVFVKADEKGEDMKRSVFFARGKKA